MRKDCLWVSVPGLILTDDDKALLRLDSVGGVVLFAHNFSDAAQLQQLTNSILQVSPDLVIAVDQEGGEIQRFQGPGFSPFPSAKQWREDYACDPVATLSALQQQTQHLAQELRAVGVDITLAPVLDVECAPHGISFIEKKSRGFGKDPATVVQLARIVIESLQAAGMPAVGKHFPGHGGIGAGEKTTVSAQSQFAQPQPITDSHLGLPVDDHSWSELQTLHLQPYVALAPQLPAIMSAHVLYPAVDCYPATFSRRWIHEILRKELHFNGAVLTDDLHMGGAQNDGCGALLVPIQRAERALAAGCDILLFCNNRPGAWAMAHWLCEQPGDAASEKRIQELQTRCVRLKIQRCKEIQPS